VLGPGLVRGDEGQVDGGLEAGAELDLRPLGSLGEPLEGLAIGLQVDAIGLLDGAKRLLEWKTTSARYPEQPEGLTSLDLQLVCYSWITGISDVAIVAFVRKRVPEIQYLLASITDEQRREFGQLVDATVGQNAISQVEIFGRVAGVTGLVMTKLDGTARGGILVAIAEKFQLPVHFIGAGEGVNDLEAFEARDFARAIAGLEV